MTMDVVGLWRCLIAYGVDHAAATEVCGGGPQTLKAALGAVPSRPLASRESEPSIWIDLEAPTEDPEFRAMALMLSALPEAPRRAILATMIGGFPIERLVAEADADESDLTDAIQRLKHADPDLSFNELCAPLLRIPVPDFGTTPKQNVPKWLPVGALAIALVVSIMVLATTPKGQSALSPAEITPTRIPPATTSSALPAPSRPTVNPDQFREPDREIEISITEEDTLVRLEPWTRRVIWESRPFAEVEILSIDPNTVTITTRGYRLFVSLTDGTLLPP